MNKEMNRVIRVNMAIRNVAWKVQKSFRFRGILGTAVRCMSKLVALAGLQSSVQSSHTDSGFEFDERYCVDTCGIIELGGLQVDSPNWRFGSSYQAVAPALFGNLIARLDIRHDEYIFIDMGSGKGRALLLASAYPFKEIIGVEFSPKLHRVAVGNIATFRSEDRRCKDIRSVCMDATAFKIPPDPAVYYFYNPFEERVMETVLKNIERSLDNCSRSVWLVFQHTALDQLAEESKWFSRTYSDERKLRTSIFKKSF